MRCVAAAALSASMILAVATAAPDTVDGFDRIGPPDPAAPTWSGDRMRDARDRLKEILPGSRA